jgi:SAM-dependent methyltransferase
MEIVMHDTIEVEAINNYWGRAGLGQTILDALTAAGKDLDALTLDDLAPMDQFHAGGKGATERLAQLADLQPDTRVLDVGGGLGGPARTLAMQFGCRVTSIDLTTSYVQAAQILTARLGLDKRVTHQTGNALQLPFDDGMFDVVWTQNSGMNIAAKEQLYKGFYRVLGAGGLLALQEPMAGPVQPPIYPLMWARNADASFLRTPAEMQTLIEAVGFRNRDWHDVTATTTARQAGAAEPAYSIQRLVMGDALEAIRAAGRRNQSEGRMVMVQAVFERS